MPKHENVSLILIQGRDVYIEAKMSNSGSEMRFLALNPLESYFDKK
jgi:hypothetical protein